MTGIAIEMALQDLYAKKHAVDSRPGYLSIRAIATAPFSYGSFALQVVVCRMYVPDVCPENTDDMYETPTPQYQQRRTQYRRGLFFFIQHSRDVGRSAQNRRQCSSTYVPRPTQYHQPRWLVVQHGHVGFRTRVVTINRV